MLYLELVENLIFLIVYVMGSSACVTLLKNLILHTYVRENNDECCCCAENSLTTLIDSHKIWLKITHTHAYVAIDFS